MESGHLCRSAQHAALEEAKGEVKKMVADAIKAEGIAEAMQDKHIMLLPVSEGGMNLKTTDINQLINTMDIRSMAGGKAAASGKQKPLDAGSIRLCL